MPQQLELSFVDGFLDRMQEVSRARDPELVVALCNDDVTFDDAGAGRLIHGKEALGELFGSMYAVAADLEIEIKDRFISLDGQTAGAIWHAKGTLHDPPGQEVEFQTAEFYQFEEDLISRWTFMARDTEWLGRQWGM